MTDKWWLGSDGGFDRGDFGRDGFSGDVDGSGGNFGGSGFGGGAWWSWWWYFCSAICLGDIKEKSYRLQIRFLQ